MSNIGNDITFDELRRQFCDLEKVAATLRAKLTEAEAQRGTLQADIDRYLEQDNENTYREQWLVEREAHRMVFKALSNATQMAERMEEVLKKPHEIRRNDDGSLDEIVGFAFVHLEQMDDHFWWMGLNTTDGRMLHVTFTTPRGKIAAKVEDQGPDDYWKQAIGGEGEEGALKAVCEHLVRGEAKASQRMCFECYGNLVESQPLAALKRLEQAIDHLADHAPLDLMKPRQIQERIRQIRGEPHMHKASIGSDQCDICLLDIRDGVHRVGVNPRLGAMSVVGIWAIIVILGAGLIWAILTGYFPSF